MHFKVRFVVYRNGKLLREDTTLLGAYEEYEKMFPAESLDFDPIADVCIFSEMLIKDHAIQIVDDEGNRLYDCFAVTG